MTAACTKTFDKIKKFLKQLEANSGNSNEKKRSYEEFSKGNVK